MTSTAPVTGLRKTWRHTAEQKATQAWRFLRLAGLALTGQVFAQVAANGFDLSKVSHLDQKAVVALLVGAAEAAWRQLHPALPASAVDTAPGATIVPAQVGVPTAVPDLTAPVDTMDVGTVPADLPDGGHAEVTGVVHMALSIAAGLIFWSLIGAHTTVY